MAPSETPDPGRFLSQVTACRREDNLFRDLYQDADEDERSVAGLRRRRRRATNDVNSVMKTLSLVEEDGTLYWRDGIPARGMARRRGGRRGLEAAADGSLVLTREFPTLAPNKIIAAVGAIDRRLNRAIDASLRSRLRQLRQTPGGSFEFQAFRTAGERAIELNPLNGPTLAGLGSMMAYAGDWEHGCALVERATQLNPRHPGWYWMALVMNAPTAGAA